MSKVYEELRTKVYSILYKEGIPLEFGCEVKREKETGEYIIDGGAVGDVCVKINEYSSREAKPWCNWWLKKEIKNLGKPLSLQSILWAINKLAKGDMIAINQIGFLYNTDKTGDFICKIDLSKPMKDQTPEVLASLLKLLE